MTTLELEQRVKYLESKERDYEAKFREIDELLDEYRKEKNKKKENNNKDWLW
jgi:hypothetical protein